MYRVQFRFFFKKEKPAHNRTRLYWPTALVTAVCLAALLVACGQSQPDLSAYTIGIINPNKGTEEIISGFIEGLADYGYTEGRNVTYIKALGVTDIDTVLPKIMKKDVDLIFTVTTPATKKVIEAAKAKNIPVVFAMHDPVRSGLLKSLTESSMNVTGIQITGSIPKALDWLLKLSPDIDTILVPVHFDSPAVQQSLDDLRRSAQKQNINLVVRQIETAADIPGIFLGLPETVDAVFLIHSILISSNTGSIVKEAGKHQLPVGGGISTYNKGALITFGVNHLEVGRQAGRLAHQILQGLRVEDIPIETAEFYLGINMQTAREAGIIVPNTILSYADHIIPEKENGRDAKLDSQ